VGGKGVAYSSFCSRFRVGLEVGGLRSERKK